MFLSRSTTGSGEPEAWTASASVQSDLDAVLGALTDPESIACWAPVSFEVEGLAGGRLRRGSRERVSGSMAGIRATYEVEVTHADRHRLELVAHGPVSLDVAYRLRQHGDGVLVDARVAIRRQRGLTAQVLRGAVGALLNAGALRIALRRLEDSLSRPGEAELLAA
jgi:Polyketide cyclase / dehydrase and lipid transport